MNEAYMFADFCNRYFKKYKYIIDILEKHKDEDGFSKISQSDIARKLNVTPSLVSKCIRRLERSDKCLEKIESGLYKVNHTDLIKYGPQRKFLEYFTAIIKDLKFLNLSIEERAIILGMSKEEVIMSNGYWGEFVKELNELNN